MTASSVPPRPTGELVPTGAEADALFARVAENRATAEDHEVFDAAVFRRFCDRVYAAQAVEPWILRLLADGFFQVLEGGEWESSFPLPWAPSPSPRPWRQERDLEISCEIHNTMHTAPNLTLEEAIKVAAHNHNVSFGTARAAYYRWEKTVSKIQR